MALIYEIRKAQRQRRQRPGPGRCREILRRLTGSLCIDVNCSYMKTAIAPGRTSLCRHEGDQSRSCADVKQLAGPFAGKPGSQKDPVGADLHRTPAVVHRELPESHRYSSFSSSS